MSIAAVRRVLLLSLLLAFPTPAQERSVLSTAGEGAAEARSGDSAPDSTARINDLVSVFLHDAPRNLAHPAAIRELSIPSHGARLPAHIYLAAGEGPHPTVVLLHGFPGNERNLDLAQALRRYGFNTLFFHYRGAWGAEGRYRLEHLPDDALAVVNWLRQPDIARDLRVDSSALGVLGHSLGGYTALAVAAMDPELRCAVALSPANPALWQRGLRAGDREVVEGLLPYADSLFMLRGFSGESLADELRVLPRSRLDTTLMGPGLEGKSLLVLVGADDTVTPAASMFEPVVAAYRAHGGIDLDAQVISGDHSFSWSRMTLAYTVLPWADSHCRPSAASGSAEAARAPDSP